MFNQNLPKIYVFINMAHWQLSCRNILYVSKSWFYYVYTVNYFQLDFNDKNLKINQISILVYLKTAYGNRLLFICMQLLVKTKHVINP